MPWPDGGCQGWKKLVTAICFGLAGLTATSGSDPPDPPAPRFLFLFPRITSTVVVATATLAPARPCSLPVAGRLGPGPTSWALMTACGFTAWFDAGDVCE